MIRPILIHPDPRLKKLCDPVAEITSEVRQLAADMLETMYDAPGIGLAAPQVGVTQAGDRDGLHQGRHPEPMALVNPEIVWSSEDQTVYEEGCLSIPDQSTTTSRAPPK
jgi:peptide deformylase